MKLIFEYLPRAYDNGPNDPEAREKMANAATMAGMAFANAFLGVMPLHGAQAGRLPPPARTAVANALILDQRACASTPPSVPDQDGHLPAVRSSPRPWHRYAEVARLSAA